MPFKGPRLASSIASGTIEIQGHHQVCCARGKGPKTSSRTTDANRDGAFFESAFLFVVQNIVAPPGLLILDDVLYLDAIMTNMMKTSKRGNVTIR